MISGSANKPVVISRTGPYAMAHAGMTARKRKAINAGKNSSDRTKYKPPKYVVICPGCNKPVIVIISFGVFRHGCGEKFHMMKGRRTLCAE